MLHGDCTLPDTACLLHPAHSPTTSDPNYIAFSASLDNMSPGATGGWVTSINTWLSAITTLQGYQGASNNKFTCGYTSDEIQGTNSSSTTN